MKKTILFLFLNIMAVALLAQNGVLTVSSPSNQKFWLFIDDVQQNQRSTYSIQIQGLELKQYKVRVEMDNFSGNSVGQKILISSLPNSNNYLVNSDRKDVFFFEKTKLSVQPVLMQNLSYQGYQQNYPENNHIPESYGHTQPGNNPFVRGSAASCMRQADFDLAYSTIQKENSDNSKLTVAKQIASRNILCTNQIVKICKLFSFENTKLEFAKYAYQYCSDKNNYYQLNDAFSSSASKSELNEFLGN